MAAEPGHFEPIHGAHAIEQVSFVLQISQPLSDEQLRAAMERIRTNFAQELPGGGEIQQLRIGFGQISVIGAQPTPVSGRVYNITRPDGVLENELRVERTTIVFRTGAYSRWNPVWERVRRYFGEIIPIYAEAGATVGFNLSFQDKFYWAGDPAFCRAEALLRPQSRYACPHVYDAPDLWHSHTGAFERTDGATKRLYNVNLDCLDENDPAAGLRRVVSITTAVTDQFNQPGYDALAVRGQDAVTHFEQRMTVMHDVSKAVFREIINGAMCQRIALG
jgi:hypothetical protein